MSDAHDGPAGRGSGADDAASRDAGARRTGALLVIAAAALWSTGGVGVKVADAAPLVVAGLRSVFALAFMLVVMTVQLRGQPRALAVIAALLRRPLVWGAAASYALMVVMFVLAARRTTAANAIFIQYTAPIYVALLSGPLLGEKPARSDLFATGACVVGMALTFGGELGGGRAAGNLLAVLSSFGFAGLPLLLRVDQKRLDPETAARAPLVAMSLGNALAAAVALPAMIAEPPSGPAAGRTLVVLILLGTLQIGLPYVFYGVAVRRLRALESSLLATIEPVLSPIWVLLATGEQPSAMAAAGGAVIVAAVVLQTIGKRRR
ncbi:MAG: DMT family transporter [Labilithrix sp.]|nr:DMT family transporter [Labilithrix sp.]MBX3219617.1 DMT family transporter [Labilithrix sp.]